jgi:cobalt/nickel transport system ATP-binding protein
MDLSLVPIELENIHFAYQPGRPVLERADFRLYGGEKVGLIGPNGSGKSTFLHIIMGLLRPSSGTVRLFGKPARSEADFQQARARIGFVFQNADDQLFSPTVLEDVSFGLLNLGLKPAEARRRALETLRGLELEGFGDRITHRLSGGEKRMVALATVLSMNPEVLLLDEPNAGLDEKTYERIIQVLQELPIGCVIVSHEYDFLARTTQSIYAVQDGKILFNGESSALHGHLHVHSGGLAPHAHGPKLPHLDHDECHKQASSLSEKEQWILRLETSIRHNREEADALRRMACDSDEETARSFQAAAEHLARQNEHLTLALAALKTRAR